jgi:hypothetical protein
MSPQGTVRCPVAVHRAVPMSDMVPKPDHKMVMAHQRSARAVPHHAVVAHAPAPAHRPLR